MKLKWLTVELMTSAKAGDIQQDFGNLAADRHQLPHGSCGRLGSTLRLKHFQCYILRMRNDDISKSKNGFAHRVIKVTCSNERTKAHQSRDHKRTP